MQKRDEPLVKKHNQAILVLPRLFSGMNFKTTITDPSWANYSWKPDLRIFAEYPAIHAENLIGKYNSYWLRMHPEVQIVSETALLKNNLIRFSFFKFAPLLFRIFIYDNGEWLATTNFYNNSSLPQVTLDSYSVLDVLPEITDITNDNQNTFTMMINELAHGHAILQYPDYIPSTNSTTNAGSGGALINEMYYHTNAASFLLLGKWFDFLKENKVYDNTRIIIVSDHGDNLFSAYPDNITLPNGKSLQAYSALLMIKDFNRQGYLHIDNTFMTNADVPVLATDGVIPQAVNPFTHAPLNSKKENGVTITTSTAWEPRKNFNNKFNIAPDEWLHVQDTIFIDKNWRKVEP
jgi:hypothetical protein